MIGKREETFDNEPDRHISRSYRGRVSKHSKYAIGVTVGGGLRLAGPLIKTATNRQGVKVIVKRITR